MTLPSSRFRVAFFPYGGHLQPPVVLSLKHVFQQSTLDADCGLMRGYSRAHPPLVSQKLQQAGAYYLVFPFNGLKLTSVIIK